MFAWFAVCEQIQHCVDNPIANHNTNQTRNKLICFNALSRKSELPIVTVSKYSK